MSETSDEFLVFCRYKPGKPVVCDTLMVEEVADSALREMDCVELGTRILTLRKTIKNLDGKLAKKIFKSKAREKRLSTAQKELEKTGHVLKNKCKITL